MEQVCEFCMALRPAVYCQADCALLCLSCDSKVHSANALSNRHPRSLLCNSCQSRPASVRCEEHRTHLCRSCDRRLHGSGTNASRQQHRRHFIGSYTGCPSAKDFAALWELDLSSSQEFLNFGNTSSGTSGQYYSSAGSLSSCMTSVCTGMSNSGTNNYRSDKIPQNSKEKKRHQSSRFILQQILNLERFHPNEGEESHFSRIMCSGVDKDVSSFSGKALRRSEEDMYENSQRSRDLEEKEELLKAVSPLDELRSEGLLAPFSALEDTPSSTADMSPLVDSFWQYRSSLQTSQFLSQNMQDIRLCEELICHDDFKFNNIPDVDVTFRNFEELFGGDQDPNLELLARDNDLSCSSVDREVSVDESGHIQPQIIEDVGADSSSYVESDELINSDMKALNNNDRIKPSYSAASSPLSLNTERQMPADSETREDAVMFY